MTKIAIIEDEVLAQQELKQMLDQINLGYEVVVSLRSIAQSVSWLKKNANGIDLIFADIELLDGKCFQVFEQVDINVPIIFLTAYDEYAVQAFKVNSIDYLLKPLEFDSLEKALDKYQRRTTDQRNVSLDEIRMLMRPEPDVYKDRIAIKAGDTYKHLPVSEVAYFQAEDKAVNLFTIRNEKYVIYQTLKELEDRLNPRHFFRVSRTHLVHINSVQRASKYFNSRLKLTLDPEPSESILISRVKVPEFLRWMDGDDLD
ncbi:MAG: LytTR family DNA-binding domain-containing protein [Bacteroidota bacterium]